MKKQVKFSYWLCDVIFTQYQNGGTAIRLIDATDGMPVATASVWINHHGLLKGDEIAIKDYSENEGVLKALVDGGIVHPPHRVVDGFPIVKLVEEK